MTGKKGCGLYRADETVGILALGSSRGSSAVSLAQSSKGRLCCAVLCCDDVLVYVSPKTLKLLLMQQKKWLIPEVCLVLR